VLHHTCNVHFTKDEEMLIKFAVKKISVLPDQEGHKGVGHFNLRAPTRKELLINE
jgi:hypothetical protein